MQLQRNILATCPRVTRFKIDWDDNPDSENIPPMQNTETESNQMYEGKSNDELLKPVSAFHEDSNSMRMEAEEMMA